MLTLTQNKAYLFIKEFFKNHGYAPTMAEVAKGIGIQSRGVAHRYVHALAQKGLLRIIPNCRRNIELLPTDEDRRYLPLIGRIAAGSPIEAIPQQETINIMDTFLGVNRFALQVKGDSMIEEGIFDEDIVVCEQSNTANNGQIVVALVDNQEATLKRIYHNADNTVTLQPANASLSPMIYPAERIHIQGIFVGLLRFSQR